VLESNQNQFVKHVALEREAPSEPILEEYILMQRPSADEKLGWNG
jgi:hypothetical protein